MLTNVDAGAESSAESATAPPAAVPESPKSPKPPEPPEPPEPSDLHKHPILHQWEFNADGSVSGRVYGKKGFKDGDAMDTSIVPEGNRFSTYVITQSGSIYRLGERIIRGPSLRVAPPPPKPESPCDEPSANDCPGLPIRRPLGGRPWLEGSGDDARAQVKFGRHGVKWLALSVAKLTPVG